jgi:hypothetical protein
MRANIFSQPLIQQNSMVQRSKRSPAKVNMQNLSNNSQTIDDLHSILEESKHFVDDLNALRVSPLKSSSPLNEYISPIAARIRGSMSPSKFSDEEKLLLKHRIKEMLELEKLNESVESNTMSPKSVRKKNLNIMEAILKEIKLDPTLYVHKRKSPSPRRDRVISSPFQRNSMIDDDDDENHRPLSPSKKYLEKRETRRLEKESPKSKHLDDELETLRNSIELNKPITQVINIDESVNKMLQLGGDTRDIRDCIDKVRQCVDKCNKSALELELDVNKLHRSKEVLHSAIYRYNQYVIAEKKKGNKSPNQSTIARSLNDNLDTLENRDLIKLAEQAKLIGKNCQELLKQDYMN